jgi:hypothetical protein
MVVTWLVDRGGAEGGKQIFKYQGTKYWLNLEGVQYILVFLFINFFNIGNMISLKNKLC